MTGGPGPAVLGWGLGPAWPRPGGSGVRSLAQGRSSSGSSQVAGRPRAAVSGWTTQSTTVWFLPRLPLPGAARLREDAGEAQIQIGFVSFFDHTIAQTSTL